MALTNFIKNMFMTPSQKKATDDAYYKKMFPFGAKQQQWENNMINELFVGRKNISTIKYLCLIRREMYIDKVVNSNMDDKATKEYNKLVKRMMVNKDEEIIVDAFAKMTNEAKNINELPSLEQIKKEAGL